MSMDLPFDERLGHAILRPMRPPKGSKAERSAFRNTLRAFRQYRTEEQHLVAKLADVRKRLRDNQDLLQSMARAWSLKLPTAISGEEYAIQRGSALFRNLPKTLDNTNGNLTLVEGILEILRRSDTPLTSTEISERLATLPSLKAGLKTKVKYVAAALARIKDEFRLDNDGRKKSAKWWIVKKRQEGGPTNGPDTR